MDINKEKLLTNEWRRVDYYLKKDNADSIKLAVFEAEKVFQKVVENKQYKGKNLEDKIVRATKEMFEPEVFLKNRDKALEMRNVVGVDLGDPYSGVEMVNIYKRAIEDMLFGIIDESRYFKIKYRLWPYYYLFYSNRKKIYRGLAIFVCIVLLMLFIADTRVGRETFDYLIEKIHLIIRIILVTVLFMFVLLFFVTFCIILLENRFKRRSLRKKE